MISAEPEGMFGSGQGRGGRAAHHFSGRQKTLLKRELYAANAGPRASHSYNVHERCMDSRDIDGGARWDASPAVKVPPQGSRANPLRWALEGGKIGRACALRCECRTPSLQQL